MHTLTHPYILQLSQVYNAVATKFSQTRSKFQHSFELDQICRIVNTYQPPSMSDSDHPKLLRILDLGCGDGRLYTYLKQHCIHDFEYRGVDISYAMIELADKVYPQVDRVVDDMNAHLSGLKPMERDIIVSIAAFQHLPTVHHRLSHLQSAYQALKYWWLCIMTNRSRSHRMCRKYWKLYCKSILTYLLTLGQYNDRNDFWIPFVCDGKTYIRYYHIFLLGELVRLYCRSGFVITQSAYIDIWGSLTQSWHTAKNTCIVGTKTIFQSWE